MTASEKAYCKWYVMFCYESLSVRIHSWLHGSQSPSCIKFPKYFWKRNANLHVASMPLLSVNRIRGVSFQRRTPPAELYTKSTTSCAAQDPILGRVKKTGAPLVLWCFLASAKYIDNCAKEWYSRKSMLYCFRNFKVLEVLSFLQSTELLQLLKLLTTFSPLELLV